MCRYQGSNKIYRYKPIVLYILYIMVFHQWRRYLDEPIVKGDSCICISWFITHPLTFLRSHWLKCVTWCEVAGRVPRMGIKLYTPPDLISVFRFCPPFVNKHFENLTLSLLGCLWQTSLKMCSVFFLSMSTENLKVAQES